MKQKELLAKAILLASEGHLLQFDKSGEPYIMHALHVMNTVKSKDPEVKQIAVMHDLIEDTDMSLLKLHSLGYSERVRKALDLLTRKEGQPYNAYMTGILTNRDAMLVKMADLRHNSDITRLKGVSKKDLDRMAKYHSAYLKIKNTLKKLS